MENVSHKSKTTAENKINQLKLSHSVHHFDGCLRLLNLFQVFALIRGQVRKLLHPLIFFVHIIVLRNVMLVQAINVNTDDKNFLETIPHNVLVLRIAKQ